MIYLLIAVKDTAVDAFQPGVHCVRAKGEAMRNFTDAVNDQNNKSLHNHASDFELWQIGELDDQTGAITAKLDRITRGADVKNT